MKEKQKEHSKGSSQLSMDLQTPAQQDSNCQQTPAVESIQTADSIAATATATKSAPLILVAATQPAPKKDAGVEAKLPTQRQSDSSDHYDHDEPLTTKVNKVYKKRHRKPNPNMTDSDESYVEHLRKSLHPEEEPNRNRTSLATDAPLTDASDNFTKVSESSSNQFSSSDNLFLDDEHSSDRSWQGRGSLQPNMRLGSGLAFIYMPIPPDGGFGWVIMVLSFLAQLIVDGIIFSIGILLPFMGEDFEVSTALVVLVGSIQIGCYFLGGAFSSALINSYGFRPVALVGVCISATAILVASFSPNLVTMIIFYSIIGGPGLSMIWVSSQLIIGFYFERYRPIAHGLACSGAGAGIFIFTLFNTDMVTIIGWRNILRVQVGLILTIFFMALFYVEVEPTAVGVMRNTVPLTSSSSNEYYGNFYVHDFLADDNTSLKSNVRLETYAPRQKRGRLHRCRQKFCPCCVKRKSKPEDDRSELNYVVRADPIQRQDLFYTGRADYEKPRAREQFDGKEVELMGTDRHIQQTAYALHNIHDYDSTDDSDVPMDPKFSVIQPIQKRKKQRKAKKRSWRWRALNRLFDVHLMKSFEFRVLLTSAFLYPMGFNIPFVYSKSRTTVEPQYAQLIGPAIGLSNFITRIASCIVSYKLRPWTNYFCGGGMVLGGSMVFISAFFGSDVVWFQILYGLCYGIAPAVFSTLRALIYVRYLGISKLTNAFGITSLAMGLGVFIGTTMGGCLINTTHSYVAAFAFAGLCIISAGCLKLILPKLVECRERGKLR